MIKFLLVTDLHYCEKNEPIERRHCLSANKLREIIGEYSKGCDFIVNLGDTADGLPGYGDQKVLMSEINDILKSSGLPYYCAIGNHDTSLPKETITELLNMPHRYYSFDSKDYTCVVLDANMNSPKKPYPEKEIKWAETFFDKKQMEWLSDVIDKSQKPVLIFCHEMFVRDTYDTIDDHVVMNKEEAVKIFEKNDKVKAAFSGHYHFGNYTYCNDIHYVTFNSLCLHEHKTFAIVTIDEGKVNIEGFGLQPSMEFNLR